MMSSPEPADIIKLATRCGYKERRPETSSTLFFKEINPDHDMPPVLINIYYTTRSIMSYMNHPFSGTNEMWRSNAYKNLDELKTYFDNPRKHSGKGYRNKDKSIRGCVKCGTFKERTEFSKNQWVIKGPDHNICKECIDRAGVVAGRSISSSPAEVNERADDDDDETELSDATRGIELGGEDFPPLTENLLSDHNANNASSKGNEKKTTTKMERRQFNCPECPKRGRGKFVFFKKVPAFKPIVKCPKCKKASRGKCSRIYPIPKESERGYGLFKCLNCDAKWGSSRAIRNIGQQCLECKEKGNLVYVKPFRLEVLKKNKTKNNGMIRVPREPIQETEEADLEYTENDRLRNSSAAENALASGGRYEGGNSAGGSFGGGRGSSYTYQKRRNNDDRVEDSEETIDSSAEETSATPGTRFGVPLGYVHHCEGCNTGLCKSRFVPKSLLHDSSDGNTVSTRQSVMTNSSIDKTDYIDRDEDFTGFEDEDEDKDEDEDDDEWLAVPVSANIT